MTANAGGNPGQDGFRTGLTFLSLFWSFVTCVSLLLLWVLRDGFPTPWPAGLAAAGIALAVYNAPLVVPSRFGILTTERLWIAFSLSILMLLLPFAAYLLGSFVLYAGAAAGYLFLAFVLLQACRLPSPRVASVIFALVFATLVACYLLSRHNFAFAPEAALTGRLYIDWYRGAATIGMLANYDTVSHGVHGLSDLKYHAGSFVWLAPFARMSDGIPIYAMAAGFAVAIYPMLLFSLCAAALALTRNPDCTSSLPRTMTLIVVACAGTAICDDIGWASYYLSASQPFGVMLILLGLPLLDAIRQPVPGLLAVLLVPLISFMKISSGCLWAVGINYVVFFRSGSLLWKGPALLVVNTVTIASIYAFVSLARETDTNSYAIVPFDFLRRWGTFSSLSTYLPAALLAVVYLAVQTRRLVSSGGRDLIDTQFLRTAECFLFISVVSIVPGLLFAISGGSAWYFMNVSQWICLALLCGYGVHLATTATSGRLATWPRGLAAGGALLASVMAAAVTLDRTVLDEIRSTDRESYRWTRKYVLQNLAAEGTVASKAGVERVASSPNSIMIDSLRKAGRDTVTFIPSDADWYWSRPGDCRIKTYLVQALTGHPVLYGLTPLAQKCENPDFDFDDALKDKHTRIVDEVALCRESRRVGFSKVAIVSPVSPESALKILSCDPTSGSNDGRPG